MSAPQSTESGSSQPRTPLRFLVRSLIALGIIALALLAGRWLIATAPKANKAPRPVLAPLVEIEEITQVGGPVSIRSVGTLIASREIDLASEVSGRITEVGTAFEPGGHLQTGELVVRIEDADYRLALARARSQVASAEAELKIEEGNRLVAEQEYALLTEPVTDKERDLILRTAQREGLVAALAAAQADAEQARLNLERTLIRAPFNATLQSVAVNLGSRIAAGTTIARLVATDRAWVEVTVPHSKLERIRIASSEQSGARAFIRSHAGGNGERTGEVVRLLPDVDSKGKMARLLIAVDNPFATGNNQPRLLLGDFVSVRIEGEPLANAVPLDRRYLRDGNQVWLLNAENSLEITPVTIAWRDEDSVLVSSGLQPGMRVITTTIAAPVAGMPLRLAGDTPAPTPGRGQGQGKQGGRQ